jgi:hypothetical protein
VAFSLYHYSLVRYIQTHPYAHPPEQVPVMEREFERLIKTNLDLDMGSNAEEHPELHATDPRAIEFRNSLRPWFNHAPWSHIRTRELRRWLYWSIFNALHPRDDADMPEAHARALDKAVKLICKRTGTIVEEGSYPGVKPLLLTVDPVTVNSRPLLWYLFVAAGTKYACWLLRKHGVQFSSYNGIE